MDIEYNGVAMKLVEFTEVSREAVYDASGTDLLYIKWRIGVVATLASGGYPGGTQADFANRKQQILRENPELQGRAPRSAHPSVLGADTSRSNFPAANESTAINTSVNSAFITDADLHTRLMTPRKTLRISAWNPDGSQYVWLESPRPFTREAILQAGKEPLDSEAARAAFPPRPMTDSANGPIPLRADIVQPSGELGTFGVNFVIETALAPTSSESERLVLSHRWQTIMTHNPDHYLTRVIIGEVVFSGAILSLSATSPDWYRSQFFHPIPLGFRREVPQVALSPDGLTLRYEIHDTDPTITFDPGDSGATEIEIVETCNLLTRNVWAQKVSMWLDRNMGQLSNRNGGVIPGVK